MSTDGYAAEWLEVEKALGHRPCFTGSVADIRNQFADVGKNLGPLFPPPDPSLQIEDKQINPDVTVRVFSPRPGTSAEKLPIGVFFHGGGFGVGNLDTDAPDAQYFAQNAGCVVVSVGYRLAPEVTYEDILKDAIAGYAWAWENASALGGDQDRVFAIGESAGACLATQVTRDLIEKGQRSRVRGVVALCPMVAHTASVPEKYKAIYTAYNEHSVGAPMLTKEVMETFMESAKMDPTDPSHFITGYDGIGKFPPTFIISAEKDPLRDDGVVLEAMLRDSGVTVKRQHYDGFGHIFWNFPMLKHRDIFLKDACEGIKFVLSS